ncbi:T9SS type B sorting domain-containing protein [Flavobacterium sp. AS60]|uniref:T9SS type B sorting domain-containing protein n=1 Tax=Flavobacterium anseongense TaxID=2910677 RepID=UPI001F307ACA|nr:T9SS type B sorting domain-containing protein [Flavobacterium sp. AS60]MCF6130393.1 T9SS type B sorting domain-containing protein [Flavobacterium sp. AS60]
MSVFCFSQNETNNWYFGANAGIDFSNGDVTIRNNGSMVTPAGCSSISDNNGNLLFYTNGQTVWNKNHQIMLNGEGLSGEIDGIQSSLIVPKPNDNSTYYIFYTRQAVLTSPVYYLPGIYYTEVKFDEANPFGYVTVNKDVRIAEIEATNRIAAIHHPQSDTIRVICITKPDPVFGVMIPDGEFIFRIFNVTPTGVNPTPIKRPINLSIARLGAMKIAPDGSYLAFADSAARKVYFYSYNNETISFEPYFTLPTIPAFGVFINPYGIEFSQDSKMFYYSGDGYVVQFPFRNIGGIDPADSYLMPTENPGSIQLARNGKIYIAQGNLSDPFGKVSVINKPEKIGEECAFVSESIEFEDAASTKGLPVFVASFLRNRIIPSKDDCVDVAFTFELDAYRQILSVEWDFGDGATSTDFNPTHLFSTPRIHKVKARIIMDNNQVVTLYKEVEAYPLPELEPNQILTQCDTDADGISVFNLENIKDHVVLPDPDFIYTFYHSLDDANNDRNQIPDALHYTNVSNPEEIFVKIVSSKGCVTITNFYLENYQANALPISDIYVCESSDDILNNSEGKFDLRAKQLDIRTELAMPAEFTISFYATLTDAQTKISPLDRYHTSATTVIWVRIEDDSHNCFGIMPFDAIVNSNIDLDIESQYTICDPSVQPPLILDGGNSNYSWIWKNQSGSIIATQRFFQPMQEGDYSVTVSKIENGISCSLTKEFSVTKVTAPEFIEVSAENGKIFVSVSGNSSYEFSLDGIHYFGSGSSHIFSSVAAGIHRVYVKDTNNCEKSITTEIYMMTVPAYFTPNNDGINDEWKILGLTKQFYSNAEIRIFDRFGKLLYTMDMNENQYGWPGISDKRMFPADDYWYKITLTDLENNLILKHGHFSLIR